ncbi:MAG: hypothetical protein ACI8XB_000558 [Patiriisocius sp.]|jgi:hypothetical protein
MSTNVKFEQKLPGLHKVIGMTLPLSREFMPMIAIEAFAKTIDVHPEWKLKIIGFGNLYSDIQTYIKSRSLQNRILLYGPLEESEMYDVLKRTDIILIPSDNDDESLHRNILRLGTPIIIHNNNKIKDHMNMDCGLVHYDGSLEQMTTFMDNTIRNIDKFDSTNLLIKRPEYNIANI